MSDKKSSARRATTAGGRQDLVLVGGRTRVARIIEDRGGIGRGGGRLLRVAYVGRSGQFEQVFEVPADEVAAAPTPRRKPRGTDEVKESRLFIVVVSAAARRPALL